MGIQISEKLLEFALRLIEADLERDLDRLNWIANFETFLSAAPHATAASSPQVVIFPTPQDSVKRMTLMDFREIQTETRGVLRAAVVSRISAAEKARLLHPLDIESAVHPFQFAGEVRVFTSQTRKHFFDDNPRDSFELALYAEPKPAFLMAVALVLATTERLPIGICPEDQKLFYRVRRQLFCSRQCVLRANKRAWLQRQDALKAAKKRKRKRVNKK